jgi:hypothetical protein
VDETQGLFDVLSRLSWLTDFNGVFSLVLNRIKNELASLTFFLSLEEKIKAIGLAIVFTSCGSFRWYLEFFDLNGLAVEELFEVLQEIILFECFG